MSAAQRKFAASNGLRLSYLEWGSRAVDAPTLLLLHGGSANAHWWDFVAPSLAAAHHVIALDLRGHGHSDFSAERQYGLDTHAGDVAGLVDALALPRITLVGHSFGGFTALASVPVLGERLAGLALVDSRGRISEHGARYLKTLGKFPHPVYSDPGDAVRRFRLLPPGTSAAAETLAHVAARSLIRRADGAWTLRFDRAALLGVTPRDLQTEKDLVRCPVLLVRGEQSGALTREGLAALAAELPAARCVEIEGAYHHVMLDRPAALAACLVEFARECAMRTQQASRT